MNHRLLRLVLFTVLSVVTPSIVAAASVTVLAPNNAVNWGIGSTQLLKWSHTLGSDSYVRLEKEVLASDGTVLSVETIAASVRNSSASSGSYYWVVTGPDTTRARIRVTATADPATDISNVNFTIAAPYIKLTSPSAGTSWPIGMAQRQTWATNLGPRDTVQVALSTDGGSSFAVVLGSAAASSKSISFTVPNAATAAARVRAVWINPPAGNSAEGLNPGNFRIEPAYVRLTTPNGGETWFAGTKQTIQYKTNLAPPFRLEMSLDGGTNYGVLAPQMSGTFSFVVDESLVTGAARIRITWLGTATHIEDVSDREFQVLRGLLLKDGPLSVAVRSDNGAIRGVAFGGTDVYFPGTPVSDFGFQLAADTTTFRLNNAKGRTDQPVTVNEGAGNITAYGTYVIGATQIDFERRYELLPGKNVLRITTTFLNHGPDVTLSYFDTFDPDQGDMRGWGRGTFNDVYALEGHAVARATDRGGWTVVMGSGEPGLTLGAGNPFSIDRGTTLNTFFATPYDGNGSFADSGLHVGRRVVLPQYVLQTFVYDQAYGTTLMDAEAAFRSAQQ
jgi:hypothetical protein